MASAITPDVLCDYSKVRVKASESVVLDDCEPVMLGYFGDGETPLYRHDRRRRILRRRIAVQRLQPPRLGIVSPNYS